MPCCVKNCGMKNKSFKLGLYCAKNEIDIHRLVKRMDISITKFRADAYQHGVVSKFDAMAYAFALMCRVDDILESKEYIEGLSWKRKK